MSAEPEILPAGWERNPSGQHLYTFLLKDHETAALRLYLYLRRTRPGRWQAELVGLNCPPGFHLAKTGEWYSTEPPFDAALAWKDNLFRAVRDWVDTLPVPTPTKPEPTPEPDPFLELFR